MRCGMPAVSFPVLIPCLIHCLIAAISLAITPRVCGAESLTEFSGETMGTTYSIKFQPPASFDAAAVKASIAKRLDEIDERMSTYRDDSELARFNRESKVDEWFAVSQETAEIVTLALKIAEQSEGAFDPTVGPLVDLWKFGPQSGAANFAPPADDAIQAALARVGYSKLQARTDPPALKRTVEGLTVDLSAIAKGHGSDSLAEILRDAGVEHAMVEIGGEVQTISTRPDGEPWRIGVEAPTPGERKLHSVIALDGQALATSGDYRNFYEHEGHRYSHTIDPRTGRPVEHTLGSATIRSESCARADALATAFLVMGPEAGLEFANRRDVAAMLLNRTDAGVVELRSDTFPANSVETPRDDPVVAQAEGGGSFLTLLLAGVIIFGIALFGMAIGVLINNRSIQGSCGGLAGMQDDAGNTMCGVCSDPSPDCTGEQAEETKTESSV